MCRWLAYAGSPVRLEDLLYRPVNSLVRQSRHPRLGVETINGDGFGVGWYGSQEAPGIYHSAEPVLHELSDDARPVVSEPLGDLRGAWREVPESTCLVVRGDREALREFSPLAHAPA
jgi:predicted glutamine amidotransferase